jgi:hypothetical protein
MCAFVHSGASRGQRKYGNRIAAMAGKSKARCSRKRRKQCDIDLREKWLRIGSDRRPATGTTTKAESKAPTSKSTTSCADAMNSSHDPLLIGFVEIAPRGQRTTNHREHSARGVPGFACLCVRGTIADCTPRMSRLAELAFLNSANRAREPRMAFAFFESPRTY